MVSPKFKVLNKLVSRVVLMVPEQVSQWRQDGELEFKNKIISDMELKLVEVELENQIK